MRDLFVLALGAAAGAIAGVVATRSFGGMETVAREAVRRALADQQTEASQIVESLRKDQARVSDIVADLESVEFKQRASALLDDLESQLDGAQQVMEQSGLATSGSGWLRVGDTQICWGRGETNHGSGTLGAVVEFARPFLDENAYSISVVATADKWHGNASGLLDGRTKERQQVALWPLRIDGQRKERARAFEWIAIGKWR